MSGVHLELRNEINMICEVILQVIDEEPIAVDPVLGVADTAFFKKMNIVIE